MYKLVDGMYDYLPLESYSLHKLGDCLLKSYEKHGFKRIDTPTFERYELFDDAKFNADKLFKLIDGDGSILVARPDMTMPIARVATTKVNEPKYNKYCYLANAFRFKTNVSDIREFTQAGVELFAPQSAYVDADSIALAIKSLKDSGLEDFQVDIGHVGYFKGLLEDMNIDTKSTEELIALVNSKDTFGLELFARKYDGIKSVIDAILALPMLFGGSEVLSEAKSLNISKTSLKAIVELEEINKLLTAYGLAKYISFDLSLVNGLSYYSGVVFKGISRNFGASILGGGRYDKLCDSFGRRLAATGFAIGVNNLLIAIRRETGLYMDMPKLDYIVGGASVNAVLINEFVNVNIRNGLSVENSYIDNIAEFNSYVNKSNGIRGIFFDESGEMIEVNNG